MIITDLDGTLLTRERTVSNNDINTLVDLGKLNIPRIIATGRSVLSAKRVLSDNFPIDFLIFLLTGKGSFFNRAIPAVPERVTNHRTSFAWMTRILVIFKNYVRLSKL